MKNTNAFYRTLLYMTLGTIFFIGLAIFAATQAYKQDEDIWVKMVRRLGVEVATGKTFGVVFDSHPKGENVSRIENRADFQAPGDVFRLKAVNAEIDVTVGEGERVIVQSSGVTSGGVKSKLLRVQEDSDRLTLETPEDLVVDDLKIHVQIPKSYRKKLSIHSVTGNVQLKNLDVQTIDVKMVSGETHFVDAISDLTTIKTVSGEVEIQNQKPSNIKVQTVSGDVTLNLKSVEATDFKLKSSSGKVQNDVASKAKGPFAVEVLTASGDIQVSH